MTSTMLTREDAAEHLKVSTRTIDRMSLPKIKLGRSTRYLMSDIETHIASQRQEPVTAATRPLHINTRKAKLHRPSQRSSKTSFRDRMNAAIA